MQKTARRSILFVTILLLNYPSFTHAVSAVAAKHKEVSPKQMQEALENVLNNVLNMEKILYSLRDQEKDPEKLKEIKQDISELEKAVKNASDPNSGLDELMEVEKELQKKYTPGFFRGLLQDTWGLAKTLGKTGMYNSLTAAAQRLGHVISSKVLFKNGGINAIPNRESLAILPLEAMLLSKGSTLSQNGCTEVLESSIDPQKYEEALNIHKQAIKEFYQAYLKEKGLDVNERDKALLEYFDVGISNQPGDCIAHIMDVLESLKMYGGNALGIDLEKFYKDLLEHLTKQKKTLPQILQRYVNKKRVAAVLIAGAITGLASHYLLRNQFKTGWASDTAQNNYNWALAQMLLPFGESSVATPLLKNALGLSEPYVAKLQRFLSLGLSWRFIKDSVQNLKGDPSALNFLFYVWIGLPQVAIQTCMATAEELNLTPKIKALKDWVVEKFSSKKKTKQKDEETIPEEALA